MSKSLTELISGYICRCDACEQAGNLQLIGRDLDANYIDQRFDELYGNFVISKVQDELKLQGLEPKQDWSDLQTADYQARLATRYTEIKQYVLAQGIKQFALTFENDNKTIICRCPDCDSELIRITSDFA
jgi:hypothetical protein